ncbi:hypothetical protein H7I41_24415 [Mycobacterium manitobense]|uniref:Uncharacterized protein n=1 Tax=[Mycobacterium] manitobense TaxID=190147 RepID=A0A9X2YTV9_9MYCO|nr:hypothetical protein [[Mycobacterium] manitobense]MCV7173074.1 hypothetical protein [[Mycobacterium] manitobense]
MDTFKWFCFTILGTVAEVLLFAVFVVWFTGGTDGLVAIGQMVEPVIRAFFSGG